MSTGTAMGITRRVVCLFIIISDTLARTITHSKVTIMYLPDSEFKFVIFGTFRHSLPFLFHLAKELWILWKCSVTVLTRNLEIILSRWTDRKLFIATAKSQKGACIAAFASRIKKMQLLKKELILAFSQ